MTPAARKAYKDWKATGRRGLKARRGKLQSNPLEPTAAEKKLIHAVARGCVADYSSGDFEKDDPQKGPEWGAERTIRAEVICILATGSDPAWQVSAKGVRLAGARITGRLDLEAARISCPFILSGCYVEDRIALKDAFVHSIDFYGSYVPGGINGMGLTVEHNVWLGGGFTAEGELLLVGAHIAGSLGCGNGRLENPQGYALRMDGASIKGDVFLRTDFHSKGGIRLVGATIGGQLDCSGGKFENAKGEALKMDYIVVKENISLAEGFSAKGAVQFPGANVGGQIDCSGGSFENLIGKALNVERATVRGSILLGQEFTAKGEVCLVGSTVGGQLDCSGGQFENPNGDTLSFDGIEVRGNIFLRKGFAAKGMVRFLGGTVGGQVDCSAGKFENPNGKALHLNRINVKGSIFFRQAFTARGEVWLAGSTIGGQVDCSGGKFENPAGVALSLRSAVVKGALCLADNFHSDGLIDLTQATVDTLVDEEAVWPGPGKLMLEGFTYRTIHGPCDARQRLEWLGRQTKFHSHPYEQLAWVLRQMGYVHDAKGILYAKNRQLRKAGGLGFGGRLKSHFLQVTVGYGFKPWLAVVWMLVLFAIGWGAAGWGWNAGLMVRSHPVENQVFYPAFHASLYSLSKFSLPPLTLGRRTYWRPQARKPYDRAYWLFRGYFVFQGLAGWVLTGLLIAALTGIIKKE